jgi:hypothetical protein
MSELHVTFVQVYGTIQLYQRYIFWLVACRYLLTSTQFKENFWGVITIS